jgi:hypothetical protein
MNEPQPYSIHRQGLQLAATTSKEQAKWAFQQLQTLSQGLNYAIGDWAIVCEERFGKDWVNEILEQSTFSFDQLSASVTVAKKIPPHKRVPELSFDHHVIAARHEQPELALAWAKSLGLTPMQLAVSVRANKPLNKEEIAANRSVNTWLTPLSVVDKFVAWKSKIPLSSWTQEDKEQALRDFAPIIEFVQELQKK